MATPWHERWQSGRIGFHDSTVNPDLLAHEDAFLSGAPQRVLVPLCGKSVDLPYLARQGHDVIGVELVPLAVDQLWQEMGQEPERETLGPVEVTRVDNLTVVCGDIFDVTSDLAGRVTRIWDRAAMVALPPHVRGPYVEKLRQLAAPGCKILLVTFEYDPDVMDGPPFPVARAEVLQAYEGCAVENLHSEDRIDRLQRWREAGHPYWQVHVDLITLP